MRDKIIIIIAGLLVAIFAVFSATSFYQQRQLLIKAEKYRQQALSFKDNLERVKKTLHQLKTKKDTEKKLIEELKNKNKILSLKNQEFIKENKKLKKMLEETKIIKSPPVAKSDTNRILNSFRSKIKKIMIDVDDIDIASANKKRVYDILKSIYSELNSLDVNISRLISKKTSYRKEFLQQKKILETNKKKLQEYLSLLKNAQKSNDKLKDKVKRYKQEIALLHNKIKGLNRENEQYRNLIKDAKIEKEKLKTELLSLNNELKILKEERDFLLSDKKYLLSVKENLQKESIQVYDKLRELKDKYTVLDKTLKEKENEIASLQEKISQDEDALAAIKNKYTKLEQTLKMYEEDLSKRGQLILDLEDKLKSKEASLLIFSDKDREQKKEIAILRESLVRTKLINAELLNKLNEANDNFNTLKAQWEKLKEVNAGFEKYLGGVSSEFGASSPQQLKPPSGTESLSPSNKKEVKVKIDSIQMNNEE